MDLDPHQVDPYLNGEKANAEVGGCDSYNDCGNGWRAPTKPVRLSDCERSVLAQEIVSQSRYSTRNIINMLRNPHFSPGDRGRLSQRWPMKIVTDHYEIGPGAVLSREGQNTGQPFRGVAMDTIVLTYAWSAPGEGTQCHVIATERVIPLRGDKTDTTFLCPARAGNGQANGSMFTATQQLLVELSLVRRCQM
ncbi:hypothetical protein PoB_006890500 [Plakobranchus ocellatus]|uniref:Uncharacterized protein n=1 Tax=Plakobranchus ocellatus TaxID=259542 RepID=A0AAV4DE73_9GAST|nr:hypothetical protein PoB_006890500 [Plakobranchus ocellatus]